jgi:hypothetical protein
MRLFTINAVYLNMYFNPSVYSAPVQPNQGLFDYIVRLYERELFLHLVVLGCETGAY